MTLQNLLGVSLAPITPDRTTVARLLVAAARNITDAKLAALSAQNRFDAGYKAIMQLALVVHVIPLHRQVIPWVSRANVSVVHRPNNVLKPEWEKVQ